MEGTLDCWDPQWAYKVFISEGVGLFPSRSLVWNSGIGCGIHGASEEPMFEGFDISVHGNMKIEDFREPQLSWGWSFPSEIKTDEKLKRIPVVVLTTSKSEADVMKAYGLHANCYIVKPVNFEQFADVVRNIETFWFAVVTLAKEQ